MWNLVFYAVLGMLTGAAARLFYPGREPKRIAGTVLLGGVGAVVGGLISWMAWPLVEGEFQFGNLVMALGGAGIAIFAGAVVGYSRRITGE